MLGGGLRSRSAFLVIFIIAFCFMSVSFENSTSHASVITNIKLFCLGRKRLLIFLEKYK